jgi:uncharacterized membrane protein YoaK (UPF0700 family)
MRALSLVLLSVAAGCVDAIAFLHAGAFPANMTGNSVVLALALARTGIAGALPSALALLGFIIGAVIGARLTLEPGREWSRRVNFALLAAGGLCLAAAATIGLSGDVHMTTLVLCASIAMGMQSAAVQHLNIPGVATVFVTGTLTAAVTRFVGMAAPPSPEPRPDPWLPTISWIAYFLGALIGGLQSHWNNPAPIVLPGIILAAVGLAGLQMSTSAGQSGSRGNR